VTSNINFAAINQNFPVAGQDNDTQVFRDNFDTIKTNFSEAKTEITDLQDNAARTDGDNDFLYNVVGSLTLQDAYLSKKDYASFVPSPQEISFKQAMYHVVKFNIDTNLTFVEFPTTTVDDFGLGQIGKLTLELTSNDTTKRKIAFVMSGATVKKKMNFPALTLPGSHDLEVNSATDPIIIEVWQHSTDFVFFNYIGKSS
jgi:hypothetical protein